MCIAEHVSMTRQWKGVVALTAAFIVAFVIAILLRSMVGAVTILLATLTVAFVLGISSMRTAPTHRVRTKESRASLP